MSKITHSLFILLLLTSCATSKFDYATAYKFKTIRKYPSLTEKNLKVLASPEQTLPNNLSQRKPKFIETASLKSVAVVLEDIIHPKLSNYEESDNVSKKYKRRSNKLNKIINQIRDIKSDEIITESCVVPSVQKEEFHQEQEIQEASNKSKAAIASLFLLTGAVFMVAMAHIITFIPALVLFLSSIVCGIIGHNSEKERLASFVVQLGGGLLLVLGIFILITRDYGCDFPCIGLCGG